MTDAIATRWTPARHLACRIQRACLRRGWDRGELAQRSGVSRTTLYQLLRGGVSQPRASTLKRIADALDIPVSDLVAGEDNPPGFDTASRFDRATNPCVNEVSEECAGLFAGWTAAEWDELYSSFGVGGPLTPEGVVQAAIDINRKSEVVQRLNVVLETHLRNVAVSLIDALFEQVNAAGPNVRPDDSR
ncbi:MAG: helix-turn-helix domain-containing protein [Planctomycetaceae bacterium]